MLASPSLIVVTASAIASGSSTLDSVATWAQILGGAAAVLALPFIAWQIASAKWIERANSSAALASEWRALNLGGNVSGVTAFLDVVDTRDCIEKIQRWQSASNPELRCLPRTPRDARAPLASRLEVLRRLTFFEDLSQGYNVKAIDRSIALTMGPILVYEFLDASWFIYWTRAREQEDWAFSEWEATVRDLRRKRWSRRRHSVYSLLRNAPMSFPIRAICVPPAGASDRQWLLAARLSMALALPTALGEPSVPARKRIAPIAPPLGEPSWAIALLPRTLDDSVQQRRCQKALALAITEQVDGMTPTQLAAAIDALEQGQSVVEALDARPRFEDLRFWKRS